MKPENKQTGNYPSEIRMVPTERTPENMFLCSAKIESEASRALRDFFRQGDRLPNDLQDNYTKHLMYTYDLGEKKIFWEAGPSKDFTRILYIFSTGNMEEAQGLMHNDPFYKAGIFYDDWWIQWMIHSPIWKASIQHEEILDMLCREVGVLPKYPPGFMPQILEKQISAITPPRLFASIAKMNGEYLQQIDEDIQAGKPLPVYFLDHLFYKVGPGGTGPMGYDWECGPSFDRSRDISIYSVNSVETARSVSENDAFAKYGIFQDRIYFEWCIHIPLKKASPAHIETLRMLLREAGVTLTE